MQSKRINAEKPIIRPAKKHDFCRTFPDSTSNNIAVGMVFPENNC